MEAAAWVQSIGTIIAVAAGFVLYFVEHRHAQNARHEALLGMLAMTDAWANGLKKLAALDEIARNGQWHSTADVMIRTGRSNRSLIERIDIGAIGGPRMWAAMTNFWTMLDAVDHQLNLDLAYCASHAPDAPIPPHLKPQMLDLSTQLLRAAENLRRILTRQD